MRDQKVRGFVMLLWAVVAPGSVARADVGPPVAVRLNREQIQPAIPDQPYEGSFEVVAGEDGTIQDLRIDGAGWQDLEVDAADAIGVRAGDVLRFAFFGIPGWDDQHIRIAFTFDDRPVVQSFDLSQERFAQFKKSGHVVSIDDKNHISPFRPRLSDSHVAAGGQEIRFHGRLVYQRPTSPSNGTLLTVGADSIHFEIKDDDPPPSDDTIYSGFTDPYGNFDISINWSDCDITGCDVPDIYIRWQTADSIVNVFTADFPVEAYTWSTENSTIDDFTGSDIDFGTLMPANANQHQAMHIHNSIVRAHRYVQIHDGTNVERVDVLWPVDETGSGAFYTNSTHAISIAPSKEWGDDTHIHEYGHHFMNFYSVNPAPDYTNGICDSDRPGHCQWCPEGGSNNDNLQAAWIEGWPNWLADVVTRSYPIDYDGYKPYTDRSEETIQTTCSCCISSGCCSLDTLPNDPFKTEGYVGALLRDIEDYTQDDHDNQDYDGDGNPDDYDGDGTGPLDCWTDAMGLGSVQIFQVVRIDKPTTIVEFINAFRNRFPQFEQDFWATVMNVSSQYQSVFPQPQPIIVSQTEGCQPFLAPDPIVLNVQGNGSLLQYQWRKNFASLADGFRISGAETATLTINPSSTTDGGIYDCLVTTCDGALSTNSVPFRVTVFAARGTGTKGGSWGNNEGQPGFGKGQLGQGNQITFPDSQFPAPMAEALDNAVRIAEGATSLHKLALMANGTVWAWGDNSRLQLGRTGISSTSIPAPVPGLAGIIDIKTGRNFSIALRADDGMVLTWGDNNSGQRGDGTPYSDPSAEPFEVPIGCVVSIAAGDSHCVAVTSDGHVWTWGSDGAYQLGYPPQSYPLGQGVPTEVPGISDAVTVAAGGDFTLVLRRNGTVLAFGSNSAGQLGDGSYANSRYTSMPVTGLADVRSIHAGETHALAILNDGTVRAWGSNEGKLGIGTTSIRETVPVQPLYVGPVLDVAAGPNHTMFLRPDHTVWTCGGGQYNEIGRRPFDGDNTWPVQVPSLHGVAAIAAGYGNSFVLTQGMGPQIVSQPFFKQATSGQSVSFTVRMFGSPTIQYEWQLNGQPLPVSGGFTGVDGATLTLYPAEGSLAGNYTVHAFNDFGEIFSQNMVLQVRCARGDTDCNGRLDQADFTDLVGCLGSPDGNGRPPSCSADDMMAVDRNHDNIIDLRDVALFLNCFRGPDQAMPAECANF